MAIAVTIRAMGRTLAIMITATTRGSWLRGDRRGWVEVGVIRAADPDLESRDRKRMTDPPFRFTSAQLHPIGQMIDDSLVERLHTRVLALTVQTWHIHVVVAATTHPVDRIVKCAKDAVRYGLRPGQPIWTTGYDKRFCFDVATVHRRINYVERHNIEIGMSRRPWEFIESFEAQRPSAPRH